MSAGVSEGVASQWIIMPEANDRMILPNCGKIRRMAEYSILPQKIKDSPHLIV